MTRIPPAWEVNGWRIRVTPGKKGPRDKRIWVAGPDGQFCLLSLASLGAITRLWYDNEERLYPRPASGGEFVLAFLRTCCESDLRTACRQYSLKPPSIVTLKELEELRKSDFAICAACWDDLTEKAAR